MKKYIAIIFSTLVVVDVWAYDGSQTVNGTTWYYNRISDGNGGYNAEITSSFSNQTTTYSGDLTIPSSIDGYQVTAIGVGAFRDCSLLTSITIPNGVTVIGEDAFRNSFYMSSIIIPNSVTTIGGSAFFGTNLETVMIPDSVMTIGELAFNFCRSLQSINVSASNRAYCAIDGVLYSEDAKELIACPGGRYLVSMPEGVMTIGDYAFYGCNHLISVSIANSVTTIGRGAFDSCESLLSINMPDSVTTIGKRAFYSCGSLTSVKISNNLSIIADEAFSYCESLESIMIPEGVIEVGKDAFCGCRKLKSVKMPNSVTIIGNGAFMSCFSLQSFVIPKSVTTIGEKAFSHCSLQSIEVSIDNISYCSIEGVLYSKNVKELILCPSEKYSISIPVSVTTIGPYAFCECSSLTSITIPNSVTAIGDYAFAYCRSLASMTLPDSVTTIENRAFSGCSSLTSITIPNSVMEIGTEAFYDCSLLQSIEIPNSVTEIGENAFLRTPFYKNQPDGMMIFGSVLYEIKGPTPSTIAIPNGVMTIVKEAFRGRRNLTSIEIPSSVETIGDSAFAYCSSLRSITIPYGVTAIAKDMFYGCSSLVSIEMPSSVTTIDANAFNGCASLSSIMMPDGVEAIGNYAFYGCSSLSSIIVPDSVKRIGLHAFYGTSFLKNQSDGMMIFGSVLYGIKGSCPNFVSIPDGVTMLGWYAFRGCASLISVAIPNSVTEIAYGAFLDCSSITSIAIPDSVTSIGDYAFEGCSSLSTVYTAYGDSSRIKMLMSEIGVDIDTIGFVEEDTLLQEEGYISGTSASEPSGKIERNDSVNDSCSFVYRLASEDDCETWIEKKVIGERRVTFTWKASCEDMFRDDPEPYDYLAFEVDGKRIAYICGETDWDNFEYEVLGEGEHTLRWVYCKDDDSSEGEDCAWIADIEIADKTAITLDDGEANQGVPPEAIVGWSNESCVLPGQGDLVYAKHHFVGWSDGSTIYKEGDSYPMNAEVKTLVVVWEEKHLGFPVVDYQSPYVGLSTEISISGESGVEILYSINEGEWFSYNAPFEVQKEASVRVYQTKDDYYDSAIVEIGVERAQYEVKFINGESVITIEHVRYGDAAVPPQVAPREGYEFVGWDKHTDSVTDNMEVSVVWAKKCAEVSFVIGEGESGSVPAKLVVRWGETVCLPECTFVKSMHSFVGWTDGENVYKVGDEFAYLEDGTALHAVWEENHLAAPTITVESYYETESTTVAITADEGALVYYTLDAEMEVDKWARYEGEFSVEGTATIRAIARMDNYFDSAISEAETTRRWSVVEYLATDMKLVDAGDASWITEKNVVGTDGYSIRSGTIDDNQMSGFSLSVDEAGALAIRCKVSSEVRKKIVRDGLAVYIDGASDRSVWLGGEIDWTNVVVNIEGAGAHSILLAYEKDSSGASGADCAWIDSIIWTPAPKPSRPEAIEGASAETQAAFEAWAQKYGVSDPSAANVNAFVMALAPEATEEEIQEAVEAALKEIDLAALAQGDISAAIESIQAKYPNAAVELAPVEDLNTSAHLYKLVIKLR